VRNYILPSFEQLFQVDAESPTTIQLSLLVIDILIKGLPMLIILGMVILFLWQQCKKHIEIDKQLYIIQKIPFVKTILKMQTSYLFAMHFSMYLQVGLSLKQVLDHLENQNRMVIISYYASLLSNQFNNGLPIADTFSQLTLLDEQINA